MKENEAFKAGGNLRGEITPPGDKSISHRASILGSLAQGKSQFKHFLVSGDSLSTLNAFKKMGVNYELSQDELVIEGVGLHGLKAPQGDLDMGNSGTTTRLLMGVLAAQSFEVQLRGDESLSRRPMDRVAEPLRKMGAEIEGHGERCTLPLSVKGKKLKGIHYRLPIPSAQVKSSILLAGLYAEGITEVVESKVTRDHTERAFKAFGVPYRQMNSCHRVEHTDSLQAVSYAIPGDFSSAAFFLVGACISQGSEIRIRNVGLNPTRIGLVQVLRRMGADIRFAHEKNDGEPVGDIIVTSSRLKGTEVGPEEVPLLIDEIPALTLAAALAEGETLIWGARELRVKESDRIRAMSQTLNRIGARVEELDDGFRIQGLDHLTGGAVSSFGDHRVAMTLCLGNLVSQKPIRVEGLECIQTSYPSFLDDFNRLKA